MKRHVQVPGVRRWAGDDLTELQSEPLRVMDDFYAEYGSLILSGCEVTGNEIKPGIVGLAGRGWDNKPTYKVVPFAGKQNVTFPCYLYLSCDTILREYEDLQQKPVAYSYTAVVSNVIPAESYIPINRTGNRRFTDAIQDSSHRFMTDAERAKLSGISYSANYYVHPDSHSLDMITESTVRKIMTSAERTKLSGIAFNANNYVHPDNASTRHVTDVEKAAWNGKAERAEVSKAVSDSKIGQRANGSLTQGGEVVASVPQLICAGEFDFQWSTIKKNTGIPFSVRYDDNRKCHIITHSYAHPDYMVLVTSGDERIHLSAQNLIPNTFIIKAKDIPEIDSPFPDYIPVSFMMIKTNIQL